MQTLWKRDPNNKFKIIPGDFSKDEFWNIKCWHVTEKIDGTNIRVIWHPEDMRVEFRGRTEEAQIPEFLLRVLERKFSIENMHNQFKESSKVILYGEGYGNKIQSVGKKYRPNNSFILFDAYIDGWWLTPDKVKVLAEELGIDYVPELNVKTIEEIIEIVKGGYKSRMSKDETLVMEGVVARSNPMVLFRDGNPVMFKLKVNDYIKLKAK